MNLPLILSSFVSIFLAELGDKTQLATMAMAGSQTGLSTKTSIFLGASLALICSTAIGVLLGSWANEHLNPKWIKGLAGLMFLVMGALYLKEAYQLQ